MNAVERAEQRAEKKRRRWPDRLLTLAAIVLIAGPLVLTALYITLSKHVDNNAQVAYVTQCGTNNDTRKGTRHIVDKLAQRSRISANAAAHAPNQTPAQIAAAAKNLKIINNLQRYAHGQLAREDCAYPPAPTTTTTTVPRRPAPTTTTGVRP